MVNQARVENWCKKNGAEWDRDSFGNLFVWFPNGGHFSVDYTHTTEVMWDERTEDKWGEEQAEFQAWEELWATLKDQVRLDCTDANRCNHWNENRDRCEYQMQTEEEYWEG